MSELRRSYKKTSHDEFTGEKTSCSREKKSKTLHVTDSSTSSGTTVIVKEENVLWNKFKQHLKTLSTGKGF